MTPDDPRHGTYAGAMAHTKQGTPKCEPCKAAAREYMRERRATNAQQRLRDKMQQWAYRTAERTLRERHRAEFEAIYRQAREDVGLDVSNAEGTRGYLRLQFDLEHDPSTFNDPAEAERAFERWLTKVMK